MDFHVMKTKNYTMVHIMESLKMEFIFIDLKPCLAKG